MSRGPEARIQDAVIKYARSRGLLCKKNEVGRYFVQSGWPDFMVFGTAKVIFMEFKAPGGALTALQEHVKKDLEGLRYKYFVVHDAAKGKKIIEGEFK